jgi:hypothetical protein
LFQRCQDWWESRMSFGRALDGPVPVKLSDRGSGFVKIARRGLALPRVVSRIESKRRQADSEDSLSYVGIRVNGLVNGIELFRQRKC